MSCLHKELKYYRESGNVVCGKCGEVWVNSKMTQSIILPSIPTQPAPPWWSNPTCWEGNGTKAVPFSGTITA